MAKVFRSWDVDQGWLLPPSVHGGVPPGHPAHFVRDTVREARRRSASQAQARMAVFTFIESFYNPVRRHAALGYRSPSHYE